MKWQSEFGWLDSQKLPPADPSMTATSPENRYTPALTDEQIQAHLAAYRSAHDPMKPLNSLTSSNPFATLAVVTSNGDIVALNQRIDLADGSFGVMLALGAATGSSAPAPAFALRRIGWVKPPDLPPGPEFGVEVHESIAQWHRLTFPGVPFRFNTRPGQNGVDIEVPEVWVPRVKFENREVKPPTNYGEISYDLQLPKWGLTPAQVQPIMYDYSGNFYLGFGKPYWQAPLSPVFPSPATDPGRQR